ncbi:MAG: asparagine synthase-related protein [Dongiaceae bacterium]
MCGIAALWDSRSRSRPGDRSTEKAGTDRDSGTTTRAPATHESEQHSGTQARSNDPGCSNSRAPETRPETRNDSHNADSRAADRESGSRAADRESGSRAADRALVEQAILRQRHRGPDGSGFMTMDGATLGHCRLAIIDPQGGHQPIGTAAGDAAIVANGMIYNDAALRAKLGSAPFRTGSDCESILHSVARKGPDAIAGLDGMFAFAMSQDGRFIAARDPIGIKPLYMGTPRATSGTGNGAGFRERSPVRHDGALLFASEIKALAGLADDVREFPAGHYWTPECGFVRYYEIPDAPPQRWALADAIAALRDTLERAVVKRLRSDVPFGCLLSGGLDSSIIAALAAKHVPDLKTFAVGLPGSPDLVAARRVAAHLGTDHRERVLAPEEIAEAMPDILYHLESFDRDLVRSAVPCWFVAKFAAAEVKVVLTGEGADELFAGYRYYRDIADPDALHAELRRSIAIMHDINLQRVDRMTMAHGLEARVPFLDKAFIALGLSLPPEWKLATRDGSAASADLPGARRIEKWILRKAFEDLLPAEIVWRDKAQFDQGSGLEAHLTSLFADPSPAEDPDRAAGGRSAEESWYRRILESRFAEPAIVTQLVSHWDIRPGDMGPGDMRPAGPNASAKTAAATGHAHHRKTRRAGPVVYH